MVYRFAVAPEIVQNYPWTSGFIIIIMNLRFNQ